MKKVDMIVKAPHIYTMAGEGVGYRENAALVVDGGVIVDVCGTDAADRDYKAEESLALDGHAVFPGFVDAHMHTACNVMRGLAQDTNNWMMYGLQPFDNAVTDEERDVGSRVAIIEAVKAGTTTLGDYENSMDNVCRFVEKIGARGHITQTIRSAVRRVYNPGELYEFDEEMGEESLKRNIELHRKWNGAAGGRIKILFGPQGADFMSMDLLLKVQKVARELNSKIHMHTQQGDRETYQIVKRYGKRPVALLQEIGYLDDMLIAVHLTDCTDEEAATVARSGASMILCPGSIGIIDGIVPPSTAFQEAGGNCALGSDQAPGNNCHNIINEMKNVALFNKIKYGNPEVMPAWKALRMATIEGARAVGLGDEVGSLENGKQADFIAVDLNRPSMLPVFTYPMRNIVPNLVYSARGSEVDLVAVAGKILVKNGDLLTVDEQDYLDKIKPLPQSIGQRAAKEFFAINGTNAQFMRDGKL